MSETDPAESGTDEAESESPEPESGTPEPDLATFAAAAPDAKVLSYPGGWHLVEKDTWQVSVSPDGLLMLPRHLHPREVEEFCAAAMSAVGVAKLQIELNDGKTTPQPTEEELAQNGVRITERGADEPEGTVPVMVTPRAANGQAHRSAIGRPRGVDPRAPRQPVQPTPPRPGGRRGRTQQQ
jgi:hypothetical protein